MENKKEFKKFCLTLHLCVNYIRSYGGDILIDLPEAWEQYNSSDKWPIFFIRKTGADLIDRYENMLISEGKPHSLKDCIEESKRSLGIDFAIEIMEHKVVITNVNLEKMYEDDLVSRLTDIVKVEEVEVVKYGDEN